MTERSPGSKPIAPPRVPLYALLVTALTLQVGCRAPAPARPTEQIHAGDDYLRRTQKRTFAEFLVGPANLRETGEPPTFQEVADKSSRKFVRGVANIATGWIEIPKQTYNTWYAERGVLSPFVGLGKGIGMAVSREVVGVYEAALPIAPAPTDWEPIIEPEFVFKSETPRSQMRHREPASAAPAYAGPPALDAAAAPPLPPVPPAPAR